MPSMYIHLGKFWKKLKKGMFPEIMRSKLIAWRKQKAIVRIEKPTRIDQARALGYKAKPGFIIVRARVRKGAMRKPRPRTGRRQKRMGVRGHVPKKSLQLIAEERANGKFPNLEVLNSYYVGENGHYKWFEVILVDPQIVSKYPGYEWLASPASRGRVYRGLTSAGMKMRGLIKSRGVRGTHKYKWEKKGF